MFTQNLGWGLLSAENTINLLAKEQHHQERSKNKSSGFNAGIAIAYNNDFTFGVTAGGNYGKGYGNGDETSWLVSKVGSLQSQTSLSRQKETNIKGSQVLGNKIHLIAQNLNIESLQDTMTYKSKQQNISARGYGSSISGSYNQSKVNTDYARYGGVSRSRTELHGFAIQCITALLTRL